MSARGQHSYKYYVSSILLFLDYKTYTVRLINITLYWTRVFPVGSAENDCRMEAVEKGWEEEKEQCWVFYCVGVEGIPYEREVEGSI